MINQSNNGILNIKIRNKSPRDNMNFLAFIKVKNRPSDKLDERFDRKNFQGELQGSRLSSRFDLLRLIMKKRSNVDTHKERSNVGYLFVK